MSKEVMKLALEALQGLADYRHTERVERALSALREALAEPQEKYTYGTPLLDAMTGKANEALDKMAKNARDIGLDYEPSSGTQVSKVWRDGGKLVAKQVPLEDFYKPAQHRAWFTVDELSAWADKKLKENPQWEEQPAQVDPCIDGSCSCCWANLDEQSAQQEPVALAHKHINATLAAFGPGEAISMTKETWAKLREAMSVLIEQTPQQEPAGSVYRYGKDSSGKQWHGIRWAASGLDLPDGTLIYTSPPAQQGQVAWTLLLTGEHHGLVGKAGEKFVGHPEHYERVDVYTSPQRTWVGLTDEDKHYLNDVLNLQGRFPVIDAIEAKLRSKNEDRD